MIKNIEDFKEYNIICTTTEDVEECLNMLNTEEQNRDIINDNYERIVYYSKHSNKYILSPGAQMDNNISFYHFKKIYNRLKKQEKEKQKLPDFEVASDGRIIKINNWKSEKYLYFIARWDYIITGFSGIERQDIEYYVNLGLAFISKEARDKAMFKLEIETKLRNIAEKLNNGRKIDWDDGTQEKYYISYDFGNNILKNWFCNYYKDIGQIYCLDENFLDVAKKEIGEENLIKYFTE